MPPIDHAPRSEPPHPAGRPQTWRVLATSVLVVGTVALLEALSFSAGSYLRGKAVFYEPPSAPDYAAYMAQRDPVLGWPSPATFGRDGRRDTRGARLDPAFPDTAAACVSLYGDSFTWSDEVDHEHAWGSVLSRLLGCRVANYGVGGYGTDQAYLRYLHHDDDEAPVVLLNHLSENVLRNVSQYLDLLYPGRGRGFKPRFVIDDGLLTLVPLPTFTRARYEAAVRAPEVHLPHEYFAPGGAAGVRHLRPPYLLAVARAFGHYHVRAALRGRARHEPFYRPEHEAQGLAVTVGILAAFSRGVRGGGKRPLVTVLPTGDDLLTFVGEGVWPYQPLLDELEARDIPVLNVGEGLVARLDGGDPCSLFDNCSAHYNERGYAFVASAVFEHLRPSVVVAAQPPLR